MQNENKEFDFPAGIGTVGSTNEPSNNVNEEIKKQLKEIEDLMRSEFQDVKQMIAGKDNNYTEEVLNTVSSEDDERVNNAVNTLEEIEDTPLKVEDGQFTEELNSVIAKLNEENSIKEEQPIVENTPEEEKIDVQEDTPFTPVNVDVIDKGEEQQDNILSIEDLEAELNASKEEPDLSEITPIPLEEPVVQSAPAVEPAPVVEPVVQSTPAVEPAPVIEPVAPSAPAVEPAPVVEPIVQSTPAVESAPVAEQVAPSTPAVEPAPVVEPVVQSTPAVEPAPVAEPVAPTTSAVVTPINGQTPVEIVTKEYAGLGLNGNVVNLPDGAAQRVNGVQEQLANKEQAVKTLVNQAA